MMTGGMSRRKRQKEAKESSELTVRYSYGLQNTEQGKGRWIQNKPSSTEGRRGRISI